MRSDVSRTPAPAGERRPNARRRGASEANSGKPLAEVVGRTEDETRVDRLGKDVALFRDFVDDHDDHDHVRLKREDLDA